MIATDPVADPLTDELLAVLDAEVALLGKRCEQLDLLAEAVAQRDDATLETLLDEIEIAQKLQEQLDRKVHAVRAALANHYGVPVEQMRLSRLVRWLSGHRKGAVDYRRQQVLLLAEDLKQKNFEAAVVLSECARLNRMLLQCLFPKDQGVTTYGSDGSAVWRFGAGAVDAER